MPVIKFENKSAKSFYYNICTKLLELHLMTDVFDQPQSQRPEPCQNRHNRSCALEYFGQK